MFATLLQTAGKALRSSNKRVLIDLLFLAGMLWVAHFWYFRSFGLYEDDYSHISPPLGWNLSDLIGSFYVLVYWPLGRPLGWFLNFSLAFLGGQLGGLPVLYIMNFLIQVSNAFLFYFLLRRIGYEVIALVGAAIFGLFPATTTHIFLMHALGQEYVSLMFLLIAMHCYLSGRKPVAYLFSLACLLTYETPYTVFLVAPLLLLPWDRKLLKQMLRHAALWLAILLTVVIIRGLMGEGRIEGAGSSVAGVVEILRRVLTSLYLGPKAALKTFAGGPLWVLSHWSPELAIVLLVSLPAFFFMLRRLGSGAAMRNAEDASDPAPGFPGLKSGWLSRFLHPQLLKLLLTAIIMLSAAYLFSFTHYPPTASYGRLTSVHLAATLGGALLFAGLALLLLTVLRTRGLGYAGVFLLALYLSSLVAYGFTIQEDFKDAWRNEQKFWSSVVAMVPDASEGTVIIVWDRGLPQSHFIESNSWADPLVLEQIFDFPAQWKTPPRVWVVDKTWTRLLDGKTGEITWVVPPATWPGGRSALPQGNTILLEYKQGKLIRDSGDFMVEGHPLHLKTLTPGANPGWQPGPLYPLLIGTTQ